MATTVTLATHRVQVYESGTLKSSITHNSLVRMQPIQRVNKILGGTAQGNTIYTPVLTTTTQWIARMLTRDNGVYEDIILGSVTDQPTWTNDAAGYSNAETAIYASFS